MYRIRIFPFTLQYNFYARSGIPTVFYQPSNGHNRQRWMNILSLDKDETLYSLSYLIYYLKFFNVLEDSKYMHLTNVKRRKILL